MLRIVAAIDQPEPTGMTLKKKISSNALTIEANSSGSVKIST